MHAFMTHHASLLASSPDQSGKIESIRRIKGVYAIPDTLILVVQWKDGAEDTVDMTPIIQQSAPFGHLEVRCRYPQQMGQHTSTSLVTVTIQTGDCVSRRFMLSKGWLREQPVWVMDQG